MIKKSSIFLCLAALLLGAGSAVRWCPRETPASPGRFAPAPKTGIVATIHDSHRPMESYSKTGDVRALPADLSLEETLSYSSRRPYAQRLAVVHKLQAVSLTPAQTVRLRAFVADAAVPEGLNIRQVRALKNDLLNVLCLVPGEEAATAAMLRALHADQTVDPGLRDYALQHLVNLAERDHSLGWSSHWTALDGTDPALAATALSHLSSLIRQPAQASVSRPSGQPASGFQPSDSARIARAALRLAADAAAPAPARTTAIQVCGQLKLPEARDLAYGLARSDRAGMPLRIAAIATLGDLGGDAATRDYLATLATGPEKRLRVPASNALKRFP